jgi:hypothetical protein
VGQCVLGRGELGQLIMNGGRLSTAARGYVAAVSLVAVLTTGMLSPADGPAISLVSVLLITGLAMLAHAYPIQGFRHQAYQMTLPFIVLAAALFSTAELVAFIVLIHLAEQARLRRPLHIQWFNACDYLLSAVIAAALYHRAGALLADGALGHVAAALAAACIFILLNRVLLTGALWLARGLSPVASGLFQPELLAADLLIAWTAGPMLVLALLVGPWMILVTACPLVLGRPALTALLVRQEEPTHQIRREAA